MSTITLEGGCLCGAVGYQVDDAFSSAFYCHCSNCRRATGSAFKPMAVAPRDRLHLSHGQSDVLYYGTPPATHDVHCGKCGSFLYSVIVETGNVHVAMGTLRDTPSIRPSFHMFAGSKAPWFEITDGLPQFEAFPE